MFEPKTPFFRRFFWRKEFKNRDLGPSKMNSSPAAGRLSIFDASLGQSNHLLLPPGIFEIQLFSASPRPEREEKKFHGFILV
jgi:hypothetical protein